MIVLLYGRTADPWVTPIIQDLQAAAAAQRREIHALAIETALRSPRQWQSVERLYVLPFDLPVALPDGFSSATPRLLAELFPTAEVVNPAAAHELVWDKIATAHRLLERGVPMPETLITDDPHEAQAFVRRHQQAILKEPRACGGHGHVVLLAGDDGALAGEVASGRRYAVELEAAGLGRRLQHGVLALPPPFYLQRLVTGVGRGGVLSQAQVLRAYIIDGQIAFWTERTRDKIRRPADFIVSATFGARYRFVRAVGDALAAVARRAAEALGLRVGVVDLLRAGDDGPFVLEADSDGQHMLIDRSFKHIPEYRDVFDIDRMIADVLMTPAAPAARPLPRRPPLARRDAPRERRDDPRVERRPRASGPRPAKPYAARPRPDGPRAAGPRSGGPRPG
ncbi:MAG: hypothetical protein SF182_29005, partial [Deltaproteobacteria bacterium]|nr:hypothetical protein [Deltaproteobacteria bacterium]